ncbi:MAG: argininosuccinate lyase [Elusimicrobiota bacterium]|nr:argininosuccinate lyase [Elusimicrobiota bacterium]
MKLWGGRFKEEQPRDFLSFESSISFDFRLAKYDIEVNRAWAKMLESIEIFTADELKKILSALNDTEHDLEKGRLKADAASHEDIHSLIEDRLFTYAGSVAKKLPAGRSRNELISADVRLYMREHTEYILGQIKGVQRSLLEAATRYSGAVMPAFTHMQQAVPVTLGHLILSYFWKLNRDKKFFKYALEETNVMPLGGGAAGGTTLAVDTDFLMTELGFSRIFENSLDGTSNRDFMLLFLEAACNMQLHFSGICEDMILFSTEYFSYLKLPDEYATGSSLMPQKKNPDFFELVRGKTGRVSGNLAALINLLKGLPSGYNRDLQEDKISLFDTVDEIEGILKLFPSVFSALEFDTPAMLKSVEKGTVCAQALAEFLVTKDVPFRKAHEIIGKIVSDNELLSRKMSDIKIEDMKVYSEFFEASVIPLLEPAGVLKQLATSSSPSPLMFEQQLRRAYEAAEE